MIRTAVILAAGSGTRLGALAGGGPKGFVEIGGMPIVERSIRSLLAHGIDRIIVGTGHASEHYDALAARVPFVTCVRNPRFATTGSTDTLAAVGAAVQADFLLLEADLVYDDLALHVLLNDPRPNVVLVSGPTQARDEVWVQAGADGALEGISKRADALARVAGEWVGISKVSLAAHRALSARRAADPTARDLEAYEGALVAIAAEHRVVVRRIDELAWGEIDDAGQLERVRMHVWPRIVAAETARTVRREVVLTPGPATTTDSVKRAQVVPDICPREPEFGELLAEIADDLTAIVGDPRTHTAVLLGGSGTAAVEAMLASAVGTGPLLVVDNGAYGARMAAIAASYGIAHATFVGDATAALDLDALAAALRRGLDGRGFTHVALVHHETTTGLLNDLAAVGALCRAHDVALLVDAVSSYAAIPIDLAAMHVTCLASTANKNLQGMAGVAFAIGSRAFFEGLPPHAGRGSYLSLREQYRFFAAERQWRFTPPVQTLYALRQALLETKLEGVAARYARYTAAWERLLAGLAPLGLAPLVAPALHSRLVTAIREPELPGYDFARMHDHCRARGYTIYPGKLAGRASFRVATIGAITAADVHGLLAALGAYLRVAAVA